MTVDPHSTNRRPWEARLNEAGARVEDELRRVVRYIDEEVVPDVRRSSSAALRTAAERLAELAAHLDDKNRADATKGRP